MRGSSTEIARGSAVFLLRVRRLLLRLRTACLFAIGMLTLLIAASHAALAQEPAGSIATAEKPAREAPTPPPAEDTRSPMQKLLDRFR